MPVLPKIISFFFVTLVVTCCSKGPMYSRKIKIPPKENEAGITGQIQNGAGTGGTNLDQTSSFVVAYSKTDSNHLWCMDLDANYEKPLSSDAIIVGDTACKLDTAVSRCTYQDKTATANYSTLWYQAFVDRAVSLTVDKAKEECETASDSGAAGKFISYIDELGHDQAEASKNSTLTKAASFRKNDGSVCSEYDATKQAVIDKLKPSFDSEVYTYSEGPCATESVVSRCLYAASSATVAHSSVIYRAPIVSSTFSSLKDTCTNAQKENIVTTFSTYVQAP